MSVDRDALIRLAAFAAVRNLAEVRRELTSRDLKLGFLYRGELNTWLQAAHLLCSSKKGMSSHQLHRILRVTYKTAWFMTHRIREAFKTNPAGPLGGSGKVVEVDETYFGMEDGTSKRDQRSKYGDKRAFHVADITGKNLKAVLTGQIAKETHVMTDSSPRYTATRKSGHFAKFDTVSHSTGEYVRGNVYTNTVEGYFLILKRGLIGTYQHVSSDHLRRYVAEFDFRYNQREVDDYQRTDQALKQIAGKRLTYRRTDKGASAS